MKFINIHTHQPSNHPKNLDVLQVQQGLNLSLPSTLFGYGVHPWSSNVEKELQLSNEVITNKNLIYIGECGLDKLKDADLATQTDIFKQHIFASEDLKKPLLIHCVRAFNELMELHKKLKPNQQWIVHGYTGSPQLAQQLINQGFMLSFGAALLRNNSKANQSLATIPHQKILLETDDTPISIEEIYAAAAKTLQLSIKEIKILIVNNFMQLFPSF